VSVPRVAVAGVVRRRQGIGEHLARFVPVHGGEVPAFLGSRPASLEEGRNVLAGHGIEAAGFCDLRELHAQAPIDALIIASPVATHAAYLDTALDLGLHVLCEKPLMGDTEDDAAATAKTVAAFEERGLLLWENVQWPFTLAAYRELLPAVADSPLRQFSMRLSPRAGGAAHMLRECMSHPLSLLQAVAPPTSDELRGLLFSSSNPDAERLEVSFRHPGGERGVAVRVELVACPEQPRPASYGLNGAVAERSVRMDDYAISFRHGDRSVPVPDPTSSLVGAFIAALRGEAAPDLPVSGPAVSWRAKALAEIVAGFARVSGRI